MFSLITILLILSRSEDPVIGTNFFEFDTIEAYTLDQVLDIVFSVLDKVKKDKPDMRIGYVSGIITSDGLDYMQKNMRELIIYTEEIQKRYNFPIFSATNVFQNKLLQKLESNGFRREDYIQFWREILSSGYITDIFMTPRWNHSQGSIDEYRTAERYGIRIHYYSHILSDES